MHKMIFVLLILHLMSCQNHDSASSLDHGTFYGEKNITAPEELQQYGQFVGEWDVDFFSRIADSTWALSKAYWKFAYILDGWAIQDYWINKGHPDSSAQKALHGTNIRIYNPQAKQWQCVWIENGSNTISDRWYSYENQEKEIILKDQTNTWEITFYNITAQSFDWKWDIMQPDSSMRTDFKIKATRM